MARKTIDVFATKIDWHDLLSRIETQVAVYYVAGGVQHGPPRRIESYEYMEDIGSARSGNLNYERVYLCFSHDAGIKVRSVRQQKGGRRYFVDQLKNSDTVVLRFGGQFEGRVMIAGHIGTISESDWSLKAFVIFQKEIRKHFVRVKSYYVGGEAHRLLVDGWRFTWNVASPKEYDLSCVNS